MKHSIKSILIFLCLIFVISCSNKFDLKVNGRINKVKVVSKSPTVGLVSDSVIRVPDSGEFSYYTFRPDNVNFLQVGESFVDPNFGSNITRLTNTYANGGDLGNFPYAKNGFANANGSLVAGPNGIIETESGKRILPDLRTPSDSSHYISFDPIDPYIYYYHDGNSLMQYSLDPNVENEDRETLIRSFDNTLKSLGGSVDWIDRSGRYMILNISGNIRVYDKQLDKLYAGSVSNNLAGGWAGISPDGQWLILGISFDFQAFKIDHSKQILNTSGHTFWTLCGDHGDLMSASDGKTYLITSSCYNYARIYAVDVSLPQSDGDMQKQRNDNIHIMDYQWGENQHYSAPSVGPMQDWAFFEIYDGNNDPSGSWHAYKNEIMMYNVITGELRRVAHHRSDESSYCAQPRVQASWDGSKLFFASNYGYSSFSGCGYADMFSINITDDSLTPPPSSDPPPSSEEPPSTTSDQTTSVQWTNLVKTKVKKTKVYKYTGCDGCSDAGAMSTKNFTNSGSVEFSIGKAQGIFAAGLGKASNLSVKMISIIHAIRFNGAGSAEIYRHSDRKYVCEVGYTANDIFKISVANNVVSYSKNNLEFCQEPLSISAELNFKVSFLSIGSYIENAKITTTSTDSIDDNNTTPTADWINFVNTNISGTQLYKTGGCDGCADAGAMTSQSFSTNGFAEFSIGDSQGMFAVGLADVLNTGVAMSDLIYAIRLNGAGSAEIYRHSDGKYICGVSYSASDIFKISVANGVVSYSRNGTKFCQESLTTSVKLNLKTSFLSQSSYIQDAIIEGN